MSLPFAMGAGDFLAEELPPVKLLIAGILTDDGSGFIGGEEKLGKTFYALAEALALALQLPHCGRFPVENRTRVLFVEEEDSPRRTQRRLRALLRGYGLDPNDPAVGAELNAWLRLSVWKGFRLDESSWVETLKAELSAFPAGVVYLDVLRKLSRKELNKAEQASELFGVLDDLRRQRGCIFRVIHHYRKQQGRRHGRGSQEMGGSFVLGAWAEQSVFLEPLGRKGSGGTLIEFQSKDAAPIPGTRFQVESEGPTDDPTLIRLRLLALPRSVAPRGNGKLLPGILKFLAAAPDRRARWKTLLEQVKTRRPDLSDAARRKALTRAIGQAREQGLLWQDEDTSEWCLCDEKRQGHVPNFSDPADAVSLEQTEFTERGQ